jgi:hypothetical protein
MQHQASLSSHWNRTENVVKGDHYRRGYIPSPIRQSWISGFDALPVATRLETASVATLCFGNRWSLSSRQE